MSVDAAAEAIKATLNEKRVAKAKAKARPSCDKVMAKGKSSAKGKGLQKVHAQCKDKPPAMPPLCKRPPLYWGGCTIYADMARRSGVAQRQATGGTAQHSASRPARRPMRGSAS